MKPVFICFEIAGLSNEWNFIGDWNIREMGRTGGLGRLGLVTRYALRAFRYTRPLDRIANEIIPFW
jgi:hypothetical protein